MKEETKEILNKLLEYFKESDINDFGYEKDKLIAYEEAQILLDYITNLQERIDKAIEYIKNNYDFYYGDELYDSYKKIINILQGEDKE